MCVWWVVCVCVVCCVCLFVVYKSLERKTIVSVRVIKLLAVDTQVVSSSF